MPAFWLAVIAVIAPIKSGPTKEVTLPVSANSPKYCDAILRRQPYQKCPGRRLQRAAGGADQASEQEISALRGA
jgi:hypothetical protein